MGGRFISFEGIDGAGKSTHIGAVAARLQKQGHAVVCSREPGGTPLAESLRELVLHSAMDDLTEVLLMFAARRDHLKRVIEPALARGATVLCDRFTDATFAYQGAGRGFDEAVLARLEGWVQEGVQPQLTLWFDIEPDLALKRIAAVRSADRFEALDGAFFERVRRGYQRRSDDDPGRFVRIDASGEREEVARRVMEALEVRGW
ncbi:MAG: dTMP kinase [Caldimonas sp.]